MLWNASENDRMLLSLATALGLDHDVFVFSICDHDPFVAIREPFTRLSLPSLSDALDAMLSCALDVVLLSDASPFVTSIQTPTVLIADSKDTSSQALSLASKVAAVSWPLAESVSRASLRSDVLVVPPAPLSSLSQSFKPHDAVLLVCDWSEDSGVVDACSLRRRARFEANLTVAAPPRMPGQDESLRKFVAATPGVTVVDLPTSPNAWVSLVASHKVLLTPALGTTAPHWSAAQALSLSRFVVGFEHPSMPSAGPDGLSLTSPGDMHGLARLLSHALSSITLPEPPLESHAPEMVEGLLVSAAF
jgi:hypothetical protein